MPATLPTTPPITALWAAGVRPELVGGAGGDVVGAVGAPPGTPLASKLPPAPPAVSVGTFKKEVSSVGLLEEDLGLAVDVLVVLRKRPVLLP